MVIGRGHEPPVWRIAERLFNAVSEPAIRLGGVMTLAECAHRVDHASDYFTLGER
jgi:hypothetical protein